MTQFRRYWIAIHPDIKRPVGGVKQIHRLAEALTMCGRDVVLIQENDEFHPGWFQSNVKTISRDRWLQLDNLDPSIDTVVLPETFVTSFHSYCDFLPKIIFNQNGAYSFGLNSSSSLNPSEIIRLYRSDDLLHVLCVSRHDYKLFVRGFGLNPSKVSIVTNGLEELLFKPASVKKRQIAYMPRKNSRDSEIVISMLKLQSSLHGWNLQPISGCPQAQVASILQDSLLFLSFGHPEGFGLPLAEALSCGCGLIGYSGLGGRELFAIAKKFQVGKEIGFGDWFGFVDSTLHYINACQTNSTWLSEALIRCSTFVREAYSQEAMRLSVASAVRNIEAH